MNNPKLLILGLIVLVYNNIKKDWNTNPSIVKVTSHTLGPSLTSISAYGGVGSKSHGLIFQERVSHKYTPKLD